MDILKQLERKINGTLEIFDRIIINGYLPQLHVFRLSGAGHLKCLHEKTGSICLTDTARLILHFI